MNTPDECDPFRPADYLREARRDLEPNETFGDRLILEMLESAYLVGQADMQRRVVSFLDRIQKARKYLDSDSYLLPTLIEEIEEAKPWLADLE